MQPLLGFFHCGCGVGVVSPAQLRFDLQSQESIAVCPLHRSPSDEQKLQRVGGGVGFFLKSRISSLVLSVLRRRSFSSP